MAAWSYSALTLFETCPKKYWHEKVKRDVKDQPNQVTNYGLEGHKHFENKLLKGTKLPMDLQHHEAVLDRIRAAPGEGLPEQKLAITRDFAPTGFFDDDVWLRSIIDYAKVNGKACLIIDHKFGRMRPGFDQVKLCAAVFSCFKPEIETYSAAYYWAKEKKLTRTKVLKDDVPGIWAEFIERSDRIDEAVAHDEFPAKPNGLCKRYCAVKSCPYNGV